MTSCRILARTIRQDQETSDFYWLDLELSPIPPTVFVFCCLTWPKDDDSAGGQGNEQPAVFTYSGDTPKSGDVPYPNSTPTSGPLSKIAATGSVAGWTGVLVGGTGTVDVYAKSDFITVGSLPGLSATWHIMLNGVSVASASQSYVSGSSWTPSQAVSITGLSVTTGDVIEHWVVLSDSRTVTAPAGAGQYVNVMTVTGNLA